MVRFLGRVCGVGLFRCAAFGRSVVRITGFLSVCGGLAVAAPPPAQADDLVGLDGQQEIEPGDQGGGWGISSPWLGDPYTSDRDPDDADDGGDFGSADAFGDDIGPADLEYGGDFDTAPARPARPARSYWDDRNPLYER